MVQWIVAGLLFNACCVDSTIFALCSLLTTFLLQERPRLDNPTEKRTDGMSQSSPNVWWHVLHRGFIDTQIDVFLGSGWTTSAEKGNLHQIVQYIYHKVAYLSLPGS